MTATVERVERMAWDDQASIRSSKWAAAVLKHNGKLLGQSRPVYLDSLLSWAIDAGLLIDPTEEAE